MNAQHPSFNAQLSIGGKGANVEGYRRDACSTRRREDTCETPASRTWRRRIRQNMCFYETNPPFLWTISCVSPVFPDTYVVCRARLQVGSFWKTNPPEGVFGGVGGRKIGKQSHLWVLPRGFGRAATRPFRGETRNVASADGWASRPYRGEMRGWEPACYLGGVGLGFWG